MASSVADPANVYDELQGMTANVTATVDVSGYNISATFPGEEVDWTLSIKIYADVPGQVEGDSGLYSTYTEFFWIPPPDLPRASDGDIAVEPEYYTCLSPLELAAGQVADAQEVDPQCRGVVTDECLQDLNDMADAESWCVNDDWPDSCMELSADSSQMHMGVRVEDRDPAESWWATTANRDGHELGDTRDYDRARSTVWAVMTGFAEYDAATGLAGENSGLVLRSRLSCIRADRAGNAATTVMAAGRMNLLKAAGMALLLAALLSV